MKFRVVALRLARCRSLAREALRVLAWPAILCAGLAGTSAALATASPMFWFNLVYLGVVLLILACERILPYERAWQANDGEMREDLAHTLFTKGVAQLGAYLATLAGAASAIALQPAASQAGPWPAQWPMALQVVLGLVVAELGLYVAHRAAHEWRPLWRFHALHHSVRRLGDQHRALSYRGHADEDRMQSDALVAAGRALARVPVGQRGHRLHRPAHSLQHRRAHGLPGSDLQHAAAASLASLQAPARGQSQLR